MYRPPSRSCASCMLAYRNKLLLQQSALLPSASRPQRRRQFPRLCPPHCRVRRVPLPALPRYLLSFRLPPRLLRQHPATAVVTVTDVVAAGAERRAAPLPKRPTCSRTHSRRTLSQAVAARPFAGSVSCVSCLNAKPCLSCTGMARASTSSRMCVCVARVRHRKHSQLE